MELQRVQLPKDVPAQDIRYATPCMPRKHPLYIHVYNSRVIKVEHVQYILYTLPFSHTALHIIICIDLNWWCTHVSDGIASGLLQIELD